MRESVSSAELEDSPLREYCLIALFSMQILLHYSPNSQKWLKGSMHAASSGGTRGEFNCETKTNAAARYNPQWRHRISKT